MSDDNQGGIPEELEESGKRQINKLYLGGDEDAKDAIDKIYPSRDEKETTKQDEETV
jgi:hypothetical protein